MLINYQPVMIFWFKLIITLLLLRLPMCLASSCKVMVILYVFCVCVFLLLPLVCFPMTLTTRINFQAIGNLQITYACQCSIIVALYHLVNVFKLESWTYYSKLKRDIKLYNIKNSEKDVK